MRLADYGIAADTAKLFGDLAGGCSAFPHLCELLDPFVSPTHAFNNPSNNTWLLHDAPQLTLRLTLPLTPAGFAGRSIRPLLCLAFIRHARYRTMHGRSTNAPWRGVLPTSAIFPIRAAAWIRRFSSAR
jgi:hypothetical protein